MGFSTFRIALLRSDPAIFFCSFLYLFVPFFGGGVFFFGFFITELFIRNLSLPLLGN